MSDSQLTVAQRWSAGSIFKGAFAGAALGLADLGMDPRYGARPLKRAVERWVVAPIAAILAARGADAPASLTLVARDGEITVQG